MSVLRYFMVLLVLAVLSGSACAGTTAPVARVADDVSVPASLTIQPSNQLWTLVNGAAGWSGRTSFGIAVTPDGNIVLTGGMNSSNLLMNDTWRSADRGETWIQLNASSGWAARYHHRMVALPDGSIVLTGGQDNSARWRNDVWRSTDGGATWVQQTPAANWPIRDMHTMVVLPDASIVLMGGYYGGSNYRNDTWRSTDKGVTWTLQTSAAAWVARGLHTSVALPDGSIVLMGGIPGYRNDTWRSTNKGITWIRQTAAAPWTGRYGHSTVALPDGRIVLMGGYDSKSNYYNDIWRSADIGAAWTQSPDAGWSARAWHNSVTVPDGSIVLMGGRNSIAGYLNDVWRLPPATKIGVFRPTTHLFYEDYTGNGKWDGAVTDKSSTFGITGDIPVTGDWNIDGRTDIGVYRPSTNLFYLDYNGNGKWDGAVLDKSYTFGITGDIPVTGDWNADRKTEIGIFRPSTHLFYLDQNGNGKWDGAVSDKSYTFGITGDIPVTGDWNNNVMTEIGVFRPSTHLFYLDQNGNGKWDGAVTDRSYTFGVTTDIPITGDWDNDGETDIGVFRPSTHLFYVDYNGNNVWDGAVIDRSYSFGMSGDSPVTGKW